MRCLPNQVNTRRRWKGTFLARSLGIAKSFRPCCALVSVLLTCDRTSWKPSILIFCVVCARARARAQTHPQIPRERRARGLQTGKRACFYDMLLTNSQAILCTFHGVGRTRRARMPPFLSTRVCMSHSWRRVVRYHGKLLCMPPSKLWRRRKRRRTRIS